MVSESTGIELVLIPIEEVQNVRWNAQKAEILRRKKEESGLSYKQIEHKTQELGCRCSDAFIIRLAQGEYAGVSVIQLDTLCKALGISMKEFIPKIELKISGYPLDFANHS